MVGAGINVFAVWNYIITKARASSVEINPRMLAFTLGGKESDIESALEFLQKPDPESRSKMEGGRRLIREGQFQYRVVNWDHYQRIRNEDDRREYNRRKQAEYRARKAGARQELSDPGDEPDTDKQRRAARANAKIAEQEAVQDEVRSRFNPGYDPKNEKPKVVIPSGETIKSVLEKNQRAAYEADKKLLSQSPGWKNSQPHPGE